MKRPQPRIGKTLYRPVRLMIWPLASEVSSRPSIIGSIRSPDSVGDAPCYLLHVERAGR